MLQRLCVDASPYCTLSCVLTCRAGTALAPCFLFVVAVWRSGCPREFEFAIALVSIFCFVLCSSHAGYPSRVVPFRLFRVGRQLSRAWREVGRGWCRCCRSVASCMWRPLRPCVALCFQCSVERICEHGAALTFCLRWCLRVLAESFAQGVWVTAFQQLGGLSCVLARLFLYVLLVAVRGSCCRGPESGPFVR